MTGCECCKEDFKHQLDRHVVEFTVNGQVIGRKFMCTDCTLTEHKRFSELGLNPEWFRVGPDGERTYGPPDPKPEPKPVADAGR